MPAHLRAVIDKFRDTGVRIEEGPDNLRVRAPRQVRAADVRTQPYPGFPTDMQAQYMALMTQAEGPSTISETIFENRFMHVAELERMGASVRVDGRTAVVRGPDAAVRRAGDGDGPAGLRKPRAGRARPPAARRSSSASTTSTAATTGSTRSCAASGRTSKD